MFNNTNIITDGVEIFHKRISDDITLLLADATEEDLELISEIKSDSRRAEILTTRALIRSVFGEDATLAHSDDGSPFLVGCNLNISISHCRGMVVIATHPYKKIGIDIERWRNTLLKVKHKFLSQEEIEYYTSPTDLLTAWTCKEAVYKAAGCQGLDFAHDIKLPLNSIDTKAIVSLSKGDRQFCLFTTASSEFTLSIAIPC